MEQEGRRVNEFEEGMENWYIIQERLEETLDENPKARFIICPLCGSDIEIEWRRDGQADVDCFCGGHFRGYV